MAPDGRGGATSPPVLRADGLGMTYVGAAGPVRALAGASFDVLDGEVLGVVGESGSGKSTLGRILVGAVRPTSGAVAISAGVPAPAVHMILQESSSSLNPRLPAWKSVAEGVTRGRRIRGEHRERARALLDEVGLVGRLQDRRPPELSGGERQRVSIARALGSGSKILVFDEAVSSLDVSARAAVLGLLTDVRASHGLSYVFISHDLSVVAHLADRLLVMSRGRIVESGPTRSVLSEPSHLYTQALLASVPMFEQHRAGTPKR